MDKGSVSNLASAALFTAGVVMPEGWARQAVLATGMFAFSGGITNALAVKMLFDRIPGLVGSGVIPARFQEIRAKIKQLILEHFFSESYLRQYLAAEKGGIRLERYVQAKGGSSRGPLAQTLEAHWDRLASPDVLRPLVDEQLERLMDSSVGGFLMMLGPDAVKPPVHQFVAGLVGGLKQRVVGLADGIQPAGGQLPVELDEDALIADLRPKVDHLLEKKLEELDAETVKRMMEDVIRSHLGWLVVWGNVFGALLGLGAVLLRLW